MNVTTGATLTVGERKVVASGDFLTATSHPDYDVGPDGTQFLIIRRTGDDVQTIVVTNWVRELIARTQQH